ncbi:MAG: ABC transporter ATP-binding protein [Gammaproteobacteria bacterium WSBS_2016_MAG_OTU1]
MSDAPVTSSAKPFFSCRGVQSYYGESYVVQNINFEIQRGEIVALLGRNGAGKTSTLRTIARMALPTLGGGEIWLEDAPLHDMSSWQASRLGVNLVQEDRRIISGLTVEENLLLAQIAPPIGWPLEQIYEHFPRLAERRKQDGITLSGGEQQMLAIARALAREIKFLLLDEPYEGLAPVIVQEIERILEGIKKLNITTLLVEQNAIAALQLADRAIILDSGEIAFIGEAKEVLENKEIRREYLAV